MLCALIMAGGRGERFWPLSTDEKPKQFLSLFENRTMIQLTVARVEKLLPLEQIFVVTAKKYIDIVKQQLPNLPEKNIIIEPIGKNTAPCIGLSAFIINKFYRDATIIVLPADHLIIDEENFRATLYKSIEFVEGQEDAIVTLGIRPDRPETGYGYIQYGSKNYNSNIYKVTKFKEKPSLEKAEEYLEHGNFLWNAGMFIWKCSTIIKLMKEYLNNTYNILSEIAIAKDLDFEKTLEENYPKVENISVDYGIIEKADNVYVIPTAFGWDDIGTWSSLNRYMQKDCYDNVCIGKVQTINSTQNIIISKEKPIVLVDFSNAFVVESDKIIFICNRNSINSIKEIKEEVRFK